VLGPIVFVCLLASLGERVFWWFVFWETGRPGGGVHCCRRGGRRCLVAGFVSLGGGSCGGGSFGVDAGKGADAAADATVLENGGWRFGGSKYCWPSRTVFSPGGGGGGRFAMGQALRQVP
jgi:hypothetical protein